MEKNTKLCFQIGLESWETVRETFSIFLAREAGKILKFPFYEER